LLGVTVSIALCLVFMLLMRLPPLERSGEGKVAQTARQTLEHSLEQLEEGKAAQTAQHPLAPSEDGEDVRDSRPSRAPNFVNELREGLRIILKDSLIVRLIIFSPVFNFAIIPLWDLVLLFFLRGELGMSVEHFGLFMALQSVANVLAALVIAKIYTDERVLRFIRFEPFFLLGCMAILVGAACLAPFAPLWAIVALSFIGSNLIGLAANFYLVGKTTLIQKRVAKDKQSRVFSLNRLTGLVAIPIGNFVFGLVVEGFGVLAALGLACVCIISMFFIVRPLSLSMLEPKE
jgi:predicted MFS family arabinose efflux permease